MIKKKALFIIIILIAAGVAGVLIYFIFFNTQAPPSENPCWYASPIRINEVLYNPQEDVNGDLSTNQTDEFIEIVCMNATFDFRGCELYENFQLIHSFPEGSIVPAGGAIVVFGGGNPLEFKGVFGGAVVQVANGIWNKDDHLSDLGANIILKKDGSIIDNVSYNGQEINQSLTRTTTACGEFKPHSEVSGFNYTPGSDINGNAFQLGFVINEVLYNPDADINGDGIFADANEWEDEFVEFVNNFAEEFDLTGCELYDKDGMIHNFSTGPIILAGGALVLFGGGNLDDYANYFGGATVLNASGYWRLANGGDKVTLMKNGFIIATFSYGSDDPNHQSITRSPDITGNYIGHLSVSLSVCSPGTKVDGSLFI
ncbi:MAG: lamin tail domain-containing protein [Candidatus Lokiarchaeota archaeon]|nr:lamin tail domain-containing protein [Candidatus Lokiarchaeota archaeon]